MDGGTVWNINLVSAIERCREQVESDEDIVLDIISCGSPHLQDYNEDKNKTINNFNRYRQIKDYDSSMADVYEFKQAFPKVNFRYYVMPSESFKGSMLDFENKTTYRHQMIGRKDGTNAINGSDMFEKMEEWGSSEEHKKKFPRLGDFMREQGHDTFVDLNFLQE
jgi:hypothetical protein